jgi:phage terminase large subunit-like protein
MLTPVYGIQEPRVSWVPPARWSLGQDACELAASAGLELDPWQRLILHGSMGETSADQWAAFEVGLIVSRQNGKGSILEARELHALFLEPATRLILHSSHEFKTAAEGFLRIKALIDNTDSLRKRVKTIRTSHGEEGIELLDGSRLRFVARSTGSGRGFSGDLVILDEAYALKAAAMAALMPTLSARPNPQIWYTSSAGMPDSDQLRRVRDRGRAGDAGRLAYFEYSASEESSLDDFEAWRQANPAIGYRIRREFIETERQALPPNEFARERLGIWPDDGSGSVISSKVWDPLSDPDSRPGRALAFAVDAAPDRNSAAIASAGMRTDGRVHTKIVDHRQGMGWIVPRLAGLISTYRPVAVMMDPAGPIGSIVADLTDVLREDFGVPDFEPVLVTAREMAQACGTFHDDAVNDRIRHCGQDVLTAALKAATTRPLGDAWAWHRRESTDDITPLVASTLAVHGFRAHGMDGSAEPFVMFR